MTLQMYAAHDVLILLAEKTTGIWVGSAKAFAANCGAGDISERQARHILECLESAGYIKRFPIRRSHRNYPILINRYLVTSGAYSGMRLNASVTTDWRIPMYESCQEHGAEHGLQDGAEHGVERAPIREGDLRLEKETKPSSLRAQKSAPSEAASALALLLKQRILQNNPNARITLAQELNWARTADLMMDRDRRSAAEIQKHIEWSQTDEFWQGNILSMTKLREKFDQLTVKMNGSGGKHGAGPGPESISATFAR